MSKPQEVEVLPCGYRAACLVPWCRRRATKVLRYLDTAHLRRIQHAYLAKRAQAAHDRRA